MEATRISTAVTCEVCSKLVSRKADLPRHMRTHAVNKEELMHACPYEGCDYKALQRSNVATHIRTHTGERPNKCPTAGCSYTTSDPGSLTRHRKSAHGYEPKAKCLTRPSAGARKAARKQRRAAPYSAPSPSSSSSSPSSPSSTDSSLDVLDTPLPELERLLEMCATFPLVSDFASLETVKSALPAYNSDLTSEFSSFTSPIAAPMVGEDFLLPFNTQLSPSAEVPWATEFPQPLPPIDKPGFEQEIASNTVFPASTSSPLPDVNWPLWSEDWSSVSPSSTPSPPLHAGNYVAPGDVNSVLFDGFLEQLSPWQTGNGCAAAPSSLPSLASQSCFDGVPSAYSPEALLFDCQPSSYEYQPSSFVAPAMAEGVFPEANNLSYLHTVPSGMNEFFTNGILAC